MKRAFLQFTSLAAVALVVAMPAAAIAQEASESGSNCGDLSGGFGRPFQLNPGRVLRLIADFNF